MLLNLFGGVRILIYLISMMLFPPGFSMENSTNRDVEMHIRVK
jgi:hypothetical protein